MSPDKPEKLEPGAISKFRKWREEHYPRGQRLPCKKRRALIKETCRMARLLAGLVPNSTLELFSGPNPSVMYVAEHIMMGPSTIESGPLGSTGATLDGFFVEADTDDEKVKAAIVDLQRVWLGILKVEPIVADEGKKGIFLDPV